MLEVRDIHVAYGAAPALRGVSLQVREGELVCVVGPNGAGKTTLIGTIAGLQRARAGRLAIGGRDLTALPPHRFCDEGIAIVPEGRRLFTGMTVRENLELGSFVARAKPHRSASLAAALALFPALEAKLSSPAGELSGGQQQMVAIARALMAQPKLLLLDEPSLGLSPILVTQIFSIIRRINQEQGVSILLVEQNAHIALQTADYGYILEVGRIVLQDECRALLEREDIREFYLGQKDAGIRGARRWKRKKLWRS